MSLRKLKKKTKARRKGGIKSTAVSSKTEAQLLNRAESLLQSGHATGAEEACREILARNPHHPRALHLLGILAFNGGRDILAEAYLDKALRQGPREAETLHALGLLYLETNRPEQARPLLGEAITSSPGRAEYHVTLGNALCALDAHNEARISFEKALTLKQNFPEAMVAMGSCLGSTGDKDGKKQWYEQVLAIDPHTAEHFKKKAQAYLKRGKPELAINTLEQAAEIDPNNLEILVTIGATLREQNHPSRALYHLEKALALHPDSYLALYNKANALHDLGRFPEADPLLRRALELQPDFAPAYSVLVTGTKYISSSHADIRSGESMLALEKPGSSNAMLLHFALGKAYDDCEEYDKAFGHYQRGNRIKHRSATFHREAPRLFVDRLISTFSRNFPDRARAHGCSSELPVFVVGMPRSGTTLIERIIASHPQAHGIGESTQLNEITEKISQIFSTSLESCPINALTEKHLSGLAGSYLEAATKMAGTAPLRVVDKMPQNFFHLGWINLLFPRARIIHCRRNPLDTCLSIFFQFFPGDHPYAYDLTDLATYYAEYLRLMDHWRTTLTVPMLEVDYEDLIADPVELSKKIIRFLGLAWDPSTLAFHQKKGMVQSASSWQVRQPLYSRSVHRWRNYQEHIAPLLAILDKENNSD